MTADEIIDKEIRASEKSRREDIVKKREKAARLLAEADESEKLLEKQLRCNTARAHEFTTTPGSGMLGDRFEEKCRHCGWIHTC